MPPSPTPKARILLMFSSKIPRSRKKKKKKKNLPRTNGVNQMSLWKKILSLDHFLYQDQYLEKYWKKKKRKCPMTQHARGEETFMNDPSSLFFYSSNSMKFQK